MNTDEKELEELNEWLIKNHIVEPYDRRGFRSKPTTDPAAAFMVLDKCSEDADILISKNQNGWSVADHNYRQYDGCDSDLLAEAETLPLALARFAKSLYSAKGRG